MFSKTFVLSAFLAVCHGLAFPIESEDAAAALEARQSTIQVGTLIAYPNTNFGGSAEILEVVNGANQFCQEWTNINTNKQLFEVKSYAGSNIGCFTFAQSACQGSSNGAFASGTHNNTALTFKSLTCAYNS